MTIKLQSGVVEIPGNSLVGANLSDMELLKIHLIDTDLSHANLSGSRMNYGFMSGSNFSHAIMIGTHMRHFWADECIFLHANLTDANLNYGQFKWSDFRHAILLNAYVAGANFEEADLRGADMRCQALDKANLNRITYDEHTLWPDGFDIGEHMKR